MLLGCKLFDAFCVCVYQSDYRTPGTLGEQRVQFRFRGLSCKAAFQVDKCETLRW